jgi:gas vesicle protein
MQQLGRGNERFQQIDAKFIEHQQILKEHDRILKEEVPKLVADARNDMLRSFASVVSQTKEDIKEAVSPLQKQIQPIVDGVNKTHALIVAILKYALGIFIAVVTAAAIGYFTGLLKLLGVY